MKLTKTTVQKLALPPGRSELLVFDESLPGFGLRIRAGGKRSWIVQYRIGRKQRRVTIGTVETLDADAARKRARDVLSRVCLGADPQMEKSEARAEAALTLGAVAALYLSQAERRLRPRSLAGVKRHLENHFAPLAERQLKALDRSDVAARLARIAHENGPYAANRARAALSALYAWAIGEGLAAANPVVGTNKATAETARDRVLSDGELQSAWGCAGDGDYGAIVRLLILTGQRREEVGGLLWSEVDLTKALWRIGGERTKNGRAHEVPLSSAAIGLLQGRTRDAGRDLVFGAGVGSFQGWSNAKSALDARVLTQMRKNDPRAQLKPWRLHDLRRTVATRLADLGEQPHVVEAVLNHVSGHKAGVAGVYNRAAYSAEKRKALDMWATHVAALTSVRESAPRAQAAE